MLAPVSPETLKALQLKHPAPATDRRTPCDPGGNPRFEPLQVMKEDLSQTSLWLQQKLWEALSSSTMPASNKQHIQKAGDKLMATKHASLLQSRAQCDVDKARHIGDTATNADAAANQAAANKIAKHDELASTHIFYPVAIETGGTWSHWAVEPVPEIGRRATLITGEPRESTFLFQQLSIARQRGNAVAFLNTFDSDQTLLQS